jgi:type 1 fimbriae regulatory protein FimB
MLDQIQNLSAADAQAIVAQLLLKAQEADPAVAKKVSAKKKKKRGGSEITYLTEHELDRFFKCIESVRDRAIFRIMYHRGLRAREIAMIQLADWLEKDDRLIFKRLKGSNGGEYHLVKKEVKALRDWVRVRGREAGPLFPSNRGKGISQQMLDVLFKRYARKAGLPADKSHCHVLKHSCGTHMLNMGFSIEDVQDHLGHRQVANTLVYAKYTNKRRHERDRRLRDW